MAGSLRLSGKPVPYRRAGHRKSPPTVTAETIERHDEKISVGRAKVLSEGETGYRLAEVDQVLGCLVVQTVEHHEAEQIYIASNSKGPIIRMLNFDNG